MSRQMVRVYDVVIISDKRKVLTSCTAMFLGEPDPGNAVQMNECNSGARHNRNCGECHHFVRSII